MRDLHARVAAGSERDTWIVTEHEPVITLGRNAHSKNVLVSRELLAARGVDLEPIERGGDATYHGPGQLVIYPVMRLERFREVAPMVAKLEAATVAALGRFGILARPRKEHRGVYVGDNGIAAIGLAVKQMTTLHGIALNVATVLDYDRLITPCGTPQFGITSMSHELGRTVPLDEAAPVLLEELGRFFDVRFRSSD